MSRASIALSRYGVLPRGCPCVRSRVLGVTTASGMRICNAQKINRRIESPHEWIV